MARKTWPCMHTNTISVSLATNLHHNNTTTMFVKKDLRKIPHILADAAPCDEQAHRVDENVAKRVKLGILTELKLARRKAEFQGSLKVLCQPSNAPSLQNLVSLSVYDCDIKSLDGIGLLGSVVGDGGRVCCPALESLNVGRNPLTTLPDELTLLSQSLKELWCDDCQIQGPLPKCVMALEKLETLHLANNHVTEMSGAIAKLQNLKSLCLDHNKIETIPKELASLKSLEVLLLRNNRITVLLDLPLNLKLLHVSSNMLEYLPSSLTQCTGLEQLFANSNKLNAIPSGIDTLLNLKRLNLSNNKIAHVPDSFITRFGEPDKITGLCTNEDGCVVYVGQNDFLMKDDTSPVKHNVSILTA
jgi:Leucine-rich repeat (LRR) protein